MFKPTAVRAIAAAEKAVTSESLILLILFIFSSKLFLIPAFSRAESLNCKAFRPLFSLSDKFFLNVIGNNIQIPPGELLFYISADERTKKPARPWYALSIGQKSRRVLSYLRFLFPKITIKRFFVCRAPS